MKVIQEAAKLDIEIKELEEDPNALDLKEIAITSLLSNKEFLSFTNSDKMNLFTLEQLINNTGSLLLTWQQIKYIRGKKRKGRIPSWFTKLEKKTLKEKSSRELLDIYKTERPNRNTSKVQLKEVSEDKRRKK